MQAQMSIAQLLADGTSVLTETVFENRFMHFEEMRRMSADITIERQTVIMYGPSELSGASVKATDLRAAAALIIAGLVAKGLTRVSELKYLDRGYYKFHELKIYDKNGSLVHDIVPVYAVVGGVSMPVLMDATKSADNIYRFEGAPGHTIPSLTYYKA